ncbi:ATP-binding protein [bacterium]|nr:ATP-binding protein [bacterium]
MKPKLPVDLTIRIPSDNQYLSLVMDASQNLAQTMGFDATKTRKIRSAVAEACSNAIEHGNKNDPNKEIFLLFRVDESRLEINITDEGDGFDLDEVKAPSIDNKVKRNDISKRGWGVFMIKKYVDEVHVGSEKNLGLTMVIYLKDQDNKTK